ncbi:MULTISPECIES: hypothetical protein [Roseomonadaceae]|uniref:hypothetical protein n=1 Tax=Roseomonadaceae TaxID=3385906 RepID=UPI001C23652F|nr:hypothetical protein [Roseomonas oleicola]
MPAAADSRPADCELTVRGQNYIRGICQFSPMQGGSFQISGGDRFAYVTVIAPGVAEASWNEDPAATHAQAPLGRLTRSGACWVGAEARICARSLSPAAQRAALAAQPDGDALFPEVALQACLGVEGALEPGAELVLRNCRVPSDLIFIRRADGGLGISRQPGLCLGLEAPGMSRPPVLILEPCQPASPRWTTRATATEAAPVRSEAGLCLTIPQLEVADARFPFRVEAVPCTSAGDRAVRFILSRG